MPARRFWVMERQIGRIMAAQEIRAAQLQGVYHPPQSHDRVRAIEDFIGRLTLEIGETTQLRRNIFVAPEAGAKAKFEKLLAN